MIFADEMAHSIPQSIQECIIRIAPLKKEIALAAQEHLNRLTKPRGSLGLLEEYLIRIAQIQERSKALSVRPSCMFTVGGDHGVCEEGVSVSSQQVTAQQMSNFARGGGAISCFCASLNIDLQVVDVGVLSDLEEHPNIIQAKIARGTKNLAKENAMSLEQTQQAIMVGITLANQAADKGYKMIGTGEMGIGNTTPSTALFCAYLGFSPEEITGIGSGITSSQLEKKVAVLHQALHLHAEVVRSKDSLGVLAALGGLEIATLCGIILGAAARNLVVVIDGFIASAALVAAWKLCPNVLEYCFLGHVSAELGHAKILQKLERAALLNFDLRLGEGTGAALAMGVLMTAVDSYNNMANFDQSGVEVPCYPE